MPRLSTIRRRVATALFVVTMLATGGPPGNVRAQAPATRPTATPVPPAAMSGAGTGFLAGQAVDAVTGQPVANTLLGLSRRRVSGPNTAPSATEVPLVLVMADAAGRFVIREIPAGPYLLLATAPGYIVSNYGQGRAGGPTRTIDLDDGERHADLVVKLWRHSVIDGTVTDEAGEPVVGAAVRVLRRAPNGPGGEPRYVPGTEAVSDDRGHYRLTMLSPGAFVVCVPQTQVTVPAAVVDTYVQSVAERGGGTAGGRLLDLMTSSSAAPSSGGGMRVGELLLLTNGGGAAVATPPGRSAMMSVYPSTCFDGDGASPGEPLVLGPGEERSGVDIRLRPAPAVRVSGIVTAAGRPVANVVVRLIRQGDRILRSDTGFEAGVTVTGTDGSFALLGVTPGQYLLKALRQGRPGLPPALSVNPAIVAAYDPAAAPGAPDLAGAQVPLSVSETDVTDLVVQLRRGATVSGRLAFTGGVQPTAAEIGRIGVLLASEDGGLPGANLQIAPVSADGSFEIAAPAPGLYSLTALRVPPGWRSTGVSIAGRPLATAIDLSDEAVTDVSLGYTDQVSSLAGTVQRAGGMDGPNPEIVVFPVDRNRWADDPLNAYQARLEQASNDGRYRIDGLLPGEYFVAAVDTADVPEIVDQTFLDAVSRFAVRVTLPAGGMVSRRLAARRAR